MKADKIRGLEAAELGRQVQETQEQLFRLRFQMGMGQTEGLKKYRALRKDQARLLTVAREKGIEPSVPRAVAAADSTKTKKVKK